MAKTQQKTKRYHGRAANVSENLFFEEYVKSVSRSKYIFLISEFNKYNLEKSKILAYVPAGLVSRSKAARIYGLSKQVKFKQKRGGEINFLFKGL